MLINVDTEHAIFNLSRKIAINIDSSIIIYLNGNLGTGKTTFAKGLIRYLGYKNIINSPTFSIIKAYEDTKIPVYHFDLYRIKNFHELQSIGMSEYAQKQCIILVEWAEKGNSIIPKSDLIINFLQKEKIRHAFLYGNTGKGKKIIFNVK